MFICKKKSLFMVDSELVWRSVVYDSYSSRALISLIAE